MHSVISFFVFRQVSIWTVFPPFSELYVNQIFSDLLVSIGLVLMFIFMQLKKKQRSYKYFYLCCIGVIFMGSFSPLIYLLYEKDLFD